ncbi:hypothetical protein CBR_g36830 [Chara braunii]|uniref:RNA-directed RNA polymerase n=1 Tax=Chara braunii TaxID=69332 RepID=A0A388LLK2_CHABU|nr:hypothetical protein CBR_g36830 [Chara braunii]|eukprot:GBG83216.1 hypothetical protein CBR_g36830 [Chara braunii]
MQLDWTAQDLAYFLSNRVDGNIVRCDFLPDKSRKLKIAHPLHNGDAAAVACPGRHAGFGWRHALVGFSSARSAHKASKKEVVIHTPSGRELCLHIRLGKRLRLLVDRVEEMLRMDERERLSSKIHHGLSSKDSDSRQRQAPRQTASAERLGITTSLPGTEDGDSRGRKDSSKASDLEPWLNPVKLKECTLYIGRRKCQRAHGNCETVKDGNPSMAMDVAWVSCPEAVTLEYDFGEQSVRLSLQMPSAKEPHGMDSAKNCKPREVLMEIPFHFIGKKAFACLQHVLLAEDQRGINCVNNEPARKNDGLLLYLDNQPFLYERSILSVHVAPNSGVDPLSWSKDGAHVLVRTGDFTRDAVIGSCELFVIVFSSKKDDALRRLRFFVEAQCVRSESAGSSYPVNCLKDAVNVQLHNLPSVEGVPLAATLTGGDTRRVGEGITGSKEEVDSCSSEVYSVDAASPMDRTVRTRQPAAWNPGMEEAMRDIPFPIAVQLGMLIDKRIVCKESVTAAFLSKLQDILHRLQSAEKASMTCGRCREDKAVAVVESALASLMISKSPEATTAQGIDFSSCHCVDPAEYLSKKYDGDSVAQNGNGSPCCANAQLGGDCAVDTPAEMSAHANGMGSEDGRGKNRSIESNSSAPSFALIYRILVTPTRVVCSGRQIEVSNRVVRHFRHVEDRFLRVKFVDEHLEGICPWALVVGNEKHSERRSGIYKQFQRVLRDGVMLFNRHYEFLAFSTSQLREHSAWFFASETGQESHSLIAMEEHVRCQRQLSRLKAIAFMGGGSSVSEPNSSLSSLEQNEMIECSSSPAAADPLLHEGDGNEEDKNSREDRASAAAVTRSGAVTANAIRGWLGDFSSIGNPAKCAARMGQCFSATRVVAVLDDKEIDWDLPDIERGGYVFSDGVGKISPSFAREIAMELGLVPPDPSTKLPGHRYPHSCEKLSDGTTGPKRPVIKINGGRMSSEHQWTLGQGWQQVQNLAVPSSFQVRFAGCKGVLAVDPTLETLPSPASHWGKPGAKPAAKVKIAIRPSMKKFESPHRELEVIQWSGPRKAYLNRQLILLLSTLGVKDEVFIALQEDMVKSLDVLIRNSGRSVLKTLHHLGGDCGSAASRSLSKRLKWLRSLHDLGQQNKDPKGISIVAKDAILENLLGDFDKEVNRQVPRQRVKSHGGISSPAMSIMIAMLAAGFDADTDPFLHSLLRSFCLAKKTDLEQRARILVPAACRAIGVMDETGTLQYGEVFLHVTSRFSNGSSMHSASPLQQCTSAGQIRTPYGSATQSCSSCSCECGKGSTHSGAISHLGKRQREEQTLSVRESALVPAAKKKAITVSSEGWMRRDQRLRKEITKGGRGGSQVRGRGSNDTGVELPADHPRPSACNCRCHLKNRLENDRGEEEERGDGTFIPSGRRVVFARNPCLHPGDIRTATVRDVPALRHLRDVIVFPQLGHRPHANECSGGDLDGDDFFVSWDERLLPPRSSVQPMDYDSGPAGNSPAGAAAASGIEAEQEDRCGVKNTVETPINIQEIQDVFLNHMSSSQLGVICNAWLATADQSPYGASDKKCRKLAELGSIAVDAAKTGVHTLDTTMLGPKAYPDYMEKHDKETYESAHILGVLYRRCKDWLPSTGVGRSEDGMKVKGPAVSTAEPVVAAATEGDGSSRGASGAYARGRRKCLPVDRHLLVDGHDKYLCEALRLKKLYDAQLRKLMMKYGASDELDVMAGRVSGSPAAYTTGKLSATSVSRTSGEDGDGGRLIIAFSELRRSIRHQAFWEMFAESYLYGNEERDRRTSAGGGQLSTRSNGGGFYGCRQNEQHVLPLTRGSQRDKKLLEEMRAKASACYAVTYDSCSLERIGVIQKDGDEWEGFHLAMQEEEEKEEEEEEEEGQEPLLSFPWVFYDILCDIKASKLEMQQKVGRPLK